MVVHYVYKSGEVRLTFMPMCGSEQLHESFEDYFAEVGVKLGRTEVDTACLRNAGSEWVKVRYSVEYC